MRNLFRFPNGTPAEIDETYRFDAAANIWNWALPQPTGPEFRQEAVPPNGSIRPPRASKRDLRMVYTTLSATALRREFERNNNGRWVTFSGSTCKKLAS